MSLREFSCENTYGKLTCTQPGQVLVIDAARYGIFGTNTDLCHHDAPPPKISQRCTYLDVGDTIRSRCRFETECEFRAHGTTFNNSDPCPGYKKYLGINYRCIPAESWASWAATSTTTRRQISTQKTLQDDSPTTQATEKMSTVLVTTGGSSYDTTPTPLITDRSTNFSVTGDTSTNSDSSSLGAGAIAGMAVGGLVLLIIIILLVFMITRKRSKKTEEIGAETKQNEIYEMNDAYETSSPSLDVTNDDYAIVDDRLDDVTTQPQQIPDNPYSYADSGQATMRNNILYGMGD